MFASLISHGQSIEELDRINGFGQFKLGSTIELFKPQLKYVMKTENGEIVYRYNSPERVYFLKRSPKSLTLTYYQNKLSGVMLSYDDHNGQIYRSLALELETMFGSPTQQRKTMVGGYYIVYNGKKVNLSTQWFRGSQTDPEEFVVEFKDQDVERKLLAKKF